MNQLKSFYDNEGQREAVREFMILVLRDMAVEKTFEGSPVIGIKEAHELVDKMFDKLEEQYGIIKKPVISNSK